MKRNNTLILDQLTQTYASNPYKAGVCVHVDQCRRRGSPCLRCGSAKWDVRSSRTTENKLREERKSSHLWIMGSCDSDGMTLHPPNAVLVVQWEWGSMERGGGTLCFTYIRSCVCFHRRSLLFTYSVVDANGCLSHRKVERTEFTVIDFTAICRSACIDSKAS